MKPREPGDPTNQQLGPKLEAGEIPIPPGTMLYSDDVSHLGITPDDKINLEGMQSFGVSSIKERHITIDEEQSYRPREEWHDIPKEGVPATIIFLGGLRPRTKIVVEKQNLKANEINQIIKLCFNIVQTEQHHRLSVDVLRKTNETMRTLKLSLESYSVAKALNPSLFTEEAFSALSLESITTDTKEQVERIGIFIERVEKGLTTSVDNINLIIKKLDDLGVAAVHDTGVGSEMWWPIKRFLKTPFGTDEIG